MASGTLELNSPDTNQFTLRPKPITAAIWFGERFPEALQFGVPFIELRESTFDGFDRVTPITINLDFMAKMLGGDPKLGHSVVYFEPEMQFYYKEPSLNLYKPTSPEKLQNYFRAMLMRCAQELPDENNKLNLCVEFRSDKNAKAVVQRAKSVLAADASFFSATSPHSRIRGVELHERIARKFVEGLVEAESGQVVLLADAYVAFLKLVKEQNLQPIRRSEFKAMVGPMIQEQFGVCLRNDLKIDERQGVRGWKGMCLASQTVPA